MITDDLLYILNKTIHGVKSSVNGIALAGATETIRFIEEGNQMTEEDLQKELAELHNPNAIALCLGLKGLKLFDEENKSVEDKKEEFLNYSKKFLIYKIPSISNITSIEKYNDKIIELMNIIQKNEDKTLKESIPAIFTEIISTSLDNYIHNETKIDIILHSFGNNFPELSDIIQEHINNNIVKPLQNERYKLEKEGGNYGVITNTVGNLTQTVGSMGPSIATAAVNPVAGIWYSGISAKGNYTQDAIEKGANLEEAVKVGTAKAVVDTVPEVLTGGLKVFGKGILDDKIKNVIIDNTKNKIMRKVTEQGLDISGEIIENTISDSINTLIERGTINPNATYTLEDFTEGAISTAVTTLTFNTITSKLPHKKNSNEINRKESGENSKDILLDKEFVSLVDNLDGIFKKVNLDNLKAKQLNGKDTYKLENEFGLVWGAKAKDGELYSEYEQVQPAERKYAVYYKANPDTYTVKPKELFDIREILQENANLKNWENVKTAILQYVNEKNIGKDIKNVICEIDDAIDVGDLHTLFNTESVRDVVEGYSKSFSATFWNYIDEKDESGFQVPTLMITDSSAMKEPKIVETLPYQQRKNGVDKITGENSKQINIDGINFLLNQDLNTEDVVNLLKIRESFNKESSLIKLIDDKLNGSMLIDNAMHIIERDKNSNQIYLIMNSDRKNKIQEEILNNPTLQQKLKETRLDLTGDIDEYMAVYVEMIENFNRKIFLEPIKQKNEIDNKTDQTTQKDNRSFIEKIKMIVQRIKTFIKTKNQKALPEASKQSEKVDKSNSELEETTSNNKTENKREAFINTLKVTNDIEAYSLNSIEGAIQQYLFSYIVESEKGSTTSYKALTGISSKTEPGPSNRNQELMFLNTLRNSGIFDIMQQNKNNNIVSSNKLETPNQPNDSSFYRIMTKAWQKSGIKQNIRLYLNPTRNNLLKLTNEILKRNGENPLYLKIESDSQIQKLASTGRGRNEKMVIYTEDKSGNLNSILNIINDIKKENPSLFKGCESMNPFMKQIEGVVAYAKNPNTDIYTQLNGNQEKIARSYNSFLARALEESTAKSLNDFSQNNSNQSLKTLTTTEKIKELLEKSPKELISKIKEYLVQCQERNPTLDIKGLESKQKYIEQR